jgi:hypothetical protein
MAAAEAGEASNIQQGRKQQQQKFTTRNSKS